MKDRPSFTTPFLQVRSIACLQWDGNISKRITIHRVSSQFLRLYKSQLPTSPSCLFLLCLFPHNSGAIHSDSTPDSNCSSLFLKRHDPPLLYNLEADPSENYNLNSTEWDSVLKQIQAIKEQFEASMVFGESEIAKGRDSALEPCCIPNCTPKPTCCRCTSAL